MPDKHELQAHQQQPYDSSFKALIDDQTISMLSFLLGEEVEYVQELKDALLREDIKPPLRVDCAYLLRNRGHLTDYVGHVEFETSPTKEMDARLLEYFSLLYRKYRKAVVSVLVSPFEKQNVPTSPLVIELEGKIILELQYRVVTLGLYKAQAILEQKRVELYTLLPTMDGATAALLIQAIEEMNELYTGQKSRFSNHLLWFSTFLDRTKTVTPEDKKEVKKKMQEFESLLYENPFVQEVREESKEEGKREGFVLGKEEGFTEGKEKGFTEGKEKGVAEGEIRASQRAVVTVIEGRFPPLTELAQEKIAKVTKPEVLNLLLKVIVSIPDEATARVLLDAAA